MASNKQKSRNELNKESISQILNESGRTAWVITKVQIPKNPRDHYAAIDSRGIEVFQAFSFGNKKPISTERRLWSEWVRSEVDHYLLKSEFTFYGESGSWNLVVLYKGKVLAEHITEKNRLPITVIPRDWWRKILGFRSKTKWKMITAGIAYLFIFSGIINAFSGGDKGANTSASPQMTANVTPVSSVNNPTNNNQTNADPNAQAKAQADAAAKAAADAKAKTAEDAKITMDKFDTVINEYNSVNDQLSQVVTGLSNGNEDPVTAYNDLSQIHSNALKVFDDANGLQIIDRYSKSKESLVVSSSYLENCIKELQTFLDDKKTSTMANATNDLKQAQQGIQITTVAIATQAIQDGYTPPSTNNAN